MLHKLIKITVIASASEAIQKCMPCGYGLPRQAFSLPRNDENNNRGH